MWLGSHWNMILADQSWLLFVEAQLKKFHAHPFIKPHGVLEIVSIWMCQFPHPIWIPNGNWLRVSVEQCSQKLAKWPQKQVVNIFAKIWCQLKNYESLQCMAQENCASTENMRLQSGSTSDKARMNFTRDKTKTTSFAAMSKSFSPTKTKCPLKKGERKIWQCEKVNKVKLAERHETVNKCNLCFFCLRTGHRISQSQANRICGKDGWSKRHNRLLHSDDNKAEMKKKQNSSIGKLTMPTQFWQQTLVPRVCRLFP